MKNSGALNLDGVQLSLFSGADHQAMLAAMQRESREAAKEAAKLDQRANSLEGLLKAGKNLTAKELHKYGARAGNRESVRIRIEELRAEAERWRRFFQHPDVLAQVQERAGTAVKPEAFAQGEMEAIRTRAVEMKGGQFTAANPAEAKRRLALLENMTPLPVRNELIGIADVVELRERAKEIYGKLEPARNLRDGKRLHFVPSAFKKIRSHSADPRIMQAVPSLRELFEYAVPLYSEAPREKRSSAVNWHTYAVKVGDGEYVRLTAWETKKGELELDFHDVNTSSPDKKKDAIPASADRVTNPLLDEERRLSKDTVQQWIDFVKSIADDPETFSQS
ncbi:MAG: hypothetical protein LBT97_06940, partial [Planctomycetota bacterium]|nr:hypothetical protein [Planctomycetota bacterium]